MPERWLGFLPKGHRLWFEPKDDPNLRRPPALRNPNAIGGRNRHDGIICVCGQMVKVEPGDPITDAHWLQAVNQCRLAMNQLPISEDGREVPMTATPHTAPAPDLPMPTLKPPVVKRADRKNPEAIHAR